MNLDDFNNSGYDNGYNIILNNLTTKLNDFINNETKIYDFNNSLRNKLDNILTQLNSLKDKIKVLLFSIDDLKQQILDNEATMNENKMNADRIISKLNEDLANKDTVITDTSSDEMKKQYQYLISENENLAKQNNVLNEKVSNYESVLNRLEKQLFELNKDQVKNIENNQISGNTINQIAQIVNSLNNDIDKYNSGSNNPGAGSNSQQGLTTFFENIFNPSSEIKRQQVPLPLKLPNRYSQNLARQRYLENISNRKSKEENQEQKGGHLYDDSLDIKLPKYNTNLNISGGKKTKKREKKMYRKKSITKKHTKSNNKKYKKQKGGYIVTQPVSSNKKILNKNRSSTGSNRLSSSVNRRSSSSKLTSRLSNRTSYIKKK